MSWHKFCINCGAGANSFKKYKKIKTKFPLKKSYQFEITICKNCGLMFNNPQPSLEDLSIFYNSIDANKTLDDSRDPRNILETKNKYKRLIFMPFIEKNIGKLKNSTIMDIGSDNGWWLGQFDKTNKLIGIEVSSANAERAANLYNVKTIQKPWSANLVENNSIDFITCLHTLEHFTDPIDALISSNISLKVGGHIHIQVPSPFGLVFKRGINFAFKPYHLYYFSQEVLKSLLLQTGFEILDSRELKSSRYGTDDKDIFNPGIFCSGITEVIAKKNVDLARIDKRKKVIYSYHYKDLLKNLKYSENRDRYFLLIDKLKKFPIIGIFFKILHKVGINIFSTNFNQDKTLKKIMQNWGEANQ